MDNPVATVVLVLILAGLAVLVVASQARALLRARAEGLPVGLFRLCGMFARRIDCGRVIEWLAKAKKEGVTVEPGLLEGMFLAKGNVPSLVNGLIAAKRAGVDVDPAAFAAHLLAGGNGRNVILGLTAARRAGRPLPFEEAAAMDFEGRDIAADMRGAPSSTE